MTYDIHCKRCGRYLGSCARDTMVTLKCPNCKGLDVYRIVLLWGVRTLSPLRTFDRTTNPYLKGQR